MFIVALLRLVRLDSQWPAGCIKMVWSALIRRAEQLRHRSAGLFMRDETANDPVSAHAYLPSHGHLTWLQGMKPSSGWRDHSKAEAVTTLLRAIRLCIPLSETECNGNCQDECTCGCQDTMTFASHTRLTGLMSKSSVPAMFTASLTTKGAGRNTRLPECLPAQGSPSGSQELEGTLCPRSQPPALTWRTQQTHVS